MQKDITILFLTVNKVPKRWAEYQKETLLNASWGCPIITISREPLDWGHNIIQDEDIGSSNVYKQMLRGAKLADTEYVGIAEDDTLYSVEHFHSRFIRPDFALYNHSCWQVQTWRPIYYLKLNPANHSLVISRKLMISALEERFAKHPNGLPVPGEIGRWRIERRLGVANIPVSFYATKVGIVHFHHQFSMDKLEQTRRKAVGWIRAFDIPHWGKAEELVKKFI